MKQCRECLKLKELREFYARKENRDGRYSECKVCVGIRTSKVQSLNKEGNKAKIARWKAKNPEYKRPPDKLPRSYYRDKNAEYYRNDPGRVLARSAKRRVARLRATLAGVDQEEILAIYRKASALGLHVDHIVPLQGREVCGLHVPWNLQMLSPRENLSKGNRL